MNFSRSGTLMLFLILALAPPGSRAADAVVDFYRDKQIRLIIGADPGGGYDITLRAIARHMGQFIPGHPTFVPENMNGASGRVAANYLFNVAPRDGSTLGSVNQAAPLDQAFQRPEVHYDVAAFGWIGNPIVDAGITMSWAGSGLATIDDVKQKGGLICGANGATAPGTTHPTILNNLLGTGIRIIPGYPGTATLNLAMERGEINCIGANTIPNMRVQAPQFLAGHKVNLLVQWGLDEDPAVLAYAGRHVPLIAELATTDRDRQALTLIASSVAIGRPLLAPPGVPADRLALLRHAFDATMQDPTFLAEARNQHIEIMPVGGEKLQQIATDVSRTPRDILARAAELATVHDAQSK